MKKITDRATPEDLESFRRWLPISQAQLAETLGIAAPSVSAYLRGRMPISRERLAEWMDRAEQIDVQRVAEREDEARRIRLAVDAYRRGIELPHNAASREMAARAAALEQDLAEHSPPAPFEVLPE